MRDYLHCSTDCVECQEGYAWGSGLGCDIMRGMTREYRKDFAGWAKVATWVDELVSPDVNCGAIYWAYVGANIGYEQDGKGEYFTRPVLVLNKYGEHQVLVVPVTSTLRKGGYDMRVMVQGMPHTVILNQFRTVDRRRIGDFIDQIGKAELAKIRERVASLVKREPKK